MEKTSQNTIVAAVGKDLKRAFADECTKRGKSMTQIVRQMAINYVNETRPKQHKIKDRISIAKEDFRAATRSSEDHRFRFTSTHPIY